MKLSTPLLIEPEGHADPLDRLSLLATAEEGYSEAWLQKLIHQQPTVLPIEKIESGFTPAISICTELPLGSKFLDNFLVTPLGNLVAVECKLWRNPQAQREVVAQIIDYAGRMQTLGYSELEGAIRAARKEPAFGLYKYVAALTPDTEQLLDEPHFIDAVSKNLRRGRCLLLIVGDGITEGAEAMTEFLQQHAGLHFALAVVQLGVYAMPGNGQRLIVPAVPMRTKNIVRGIVEIRDGQPTIVPPPASAGRTSGATLTEDQFMSGLDAIEPGTSTKLGEFLDGLSDVGIEYEFLKTLVVRMTVGDLRVIAFVVNSSGFVDTGYTSNQKDLFRPYAEQLAAGLPGAVLRETPKLWYVGRRKADGTPLTIWDFLAHQETVLSALTVLHDGMVAATNLN